MKQVFQQRDAAKARPRKPSGVQRKASIGPGGAHGVEIGATHRALERQADEAASRVLRGERDIARSLGSAPAASVQLPSSSGHPLPHQLRERLEQGFGADLDAVRIHSDAGANAAVLAEHAHAFVAGRDIYFGQGRFDPHSTEGLHLLAHEVAHVLQQTARAGEGGRLRATVQQSTGEVQRHTLDDLATVGGRGVLDRIVTNHTAASSDATLKEDVANVRTITGGTLPINLSAKNAAGDGIADLAAKRKSKPTLGFLLDCLKALGSPYTTDAQALLDNDSAFDLRIAYWSSNLIDALFDEEGDDWIAGAFQQADLKKFMARFRAMIHEFFLGPWRAPLPVEGFAAARGSINAQGVFGEPNVIPSDRVVAAFALFGLLDDARVGLFKEWAAELSDRTAAEQAKLKLGPRGPVDLRELLVNIARRWADEGNAFLPNTILNDPNQRAAAERLRTVKLATDGTTGGDLFATSADDAIAYWKSAEAELKKKVEMLDTGNLEGLLANADTLRQSDVFGDPDVAVLGSTLGVMAKELFKLSGKKAGSGDPVADLLPPPDEYKKRLDAFEATLNKVTSASMPGVRLLTALGLRAVSAPDSAKGRALGWVMVMVSRFIFQLHQYSPELEQAGTSDVRVAHRARLAWTLLANGLLIGWKPLISIAADVLRAKEIGESYLSLVGDWEPDPDRSVEDMLTEMPVQSSKPFWLSLKKSDGSIVSSPLSLRSLVQLFEADSMEKLANRLEIAVSSGRAKADVTAKDAPDLKKASEDWKADVAAKRPQRWQVKDAQFVLKPFEGRDTPEARKNPLAARPAPDVYERLIRSHDKTKTQLLPKVEPRGATIVPTSGLAAMWLIPDITPMIQALRKRPALSLIGATIADDIDWLAQLPALAGASGTSLLRDEIEGRVVETSRDVDLRLRDATNIYRSIARKLFTTHLKAFIDEAVVSALVGVDQAERVALTFMRNIQPATDTEVQQAAFILSVADELKAAFAPETDADKPDAQVGDGKRARMLDPFYRPLIELGLAWATPGEKQKLLLDVSGLDRLPARQKALRDVLTGFLRESAKLQNRFGFRAETLHAIRAMMWYPEFVPGKGDVFVFADEEWEVARIYQTFVFHPGLKTPASEPVLKAGENGDDLTDGSPLFTIRRHPIPGKPVAPGTPEAQRSDEEFNKGPEDEITVSAFKDGESKEDRFRKELQLEFFSTMFESIGLQRQMANLGAFVKAGAGLILDVVELVPGLGQGVTAARAAIAVTQFLVTDEFQALLDNIRKDPVAFVEDILKHVSEQVLTPANLWLFVLLGEMPGPIQKLLSLLPKRAGSKAASITEDKVKEESSGRLAKVIRLIKRLAVRFFSALKYLKGKFRGPVRSMQAGIVARPLLAFGLHWAIDNAEVIAEKIQEYKSVFDRASEFKKDFRERVDGLLMTLSELELPEEVVPFEWVLESVITFALRKILKGVKGKLIAKALEISGVNRLVAEQVKQALVEAGADPNILWREKVRPLVEDKFKFVRNWLIEEIYAVFDELKQFGISMDPPAKGSDAVKIKSVDDSGKTEEADQKPSATLAPTGQPPPSSWSAGAALGGPLRSDVEQRFGHDFGHVRLHTGDDAAGVTGSYGADGMTTGSHVYLRPGLSPTTGEGSRVLDHELAHVIQQTGPRPLGALHGQGPTRGVPSVGVHHEPSREAAADRAASQVRSGARGPIAIGGAGARGMQPSVGGLAKQILKKLTTADKPTAFEAEVPAGEPVPDFVEKVKKPIWEALLARLEKKDKGDYEAPGKFAVETVAAHVKGILDKAGGEVEKVAELAMHDKAGGQIKTNPDGSKQKEKEVDLSRFASLLRGFIETKTGVSIAIGLDTSGKLDKIKVTAIDLGRIDPGSDLWKAVQTNSRGIAGSKLLDEERLEIAERLKAIPDPVTVEIVSAKLPKLISVWASDKFGLHPGYLAHLKDLRKLRGKPSVLRSRDSYLLPKAADGAGLRLDTHGNLTNLDKGGQKRESHHTTQFLLIDYFSNQRKTDRPFPDRDAAGKSYDYSPIAASSVSNGLSFSGGALQSVGGIDVASLNTGARGDAMPAILIAAETHKRGNLHLQREGDWNAGKEETDGRASQGKAMNNHFRNNSLLPEEMRGGAPKFNDFVKQQPSAAIDGVSAAMRETYNWMYGRMRSALGDALPGLELAYYHAMVIADGKTIDDANRIAPSQMTKVAGDAHKQNKAIMDPAGWKTEG